MIEITDIVKSIKGRDKGKHYVVVSVEERYLNVADGKARKISCPKRKNIKHISWLEKTDIKLVDDNIYKILKKYKNGD